MNCQRWAVLAEDMKDFKYENHLDAEVHEEEEENS